MDVENLVSQDQCFMELFAGEAGLTQAVRREEMSVFEPGEIRVGGRIATGTDLLCNTTFKQLKSAIKQKKVRWLHTAPPCKTFSRARRRDQYAKARQLRSAQRPEGLEPKTWRVKEANVLASRAAQLSLLQWKVGGWFSLENPENSYIWLYGPVKRLLQLEGVKLFKGDQCAYMGEFVKPTGWLSNAPFMRIVEKRCPGKPTHVHEPLIGFTVDFYGNKVFKTSLAAEYPQGLCIELAKAYVRELKVTQRRPDSWELRIEEDARVQDPFSRRARIEQENESCIGGLRNPWHSMQLLPKWREVGSMVWRILQASLGQLSELRNPVAWVGEAHEVQPDRELAWLRQKVGHILGCEPHEHGLWGSLLEKLVLLSEDPDSEAASWPRKGTPVGIVNEIPEGGIFPKLDEDLTWQEGDRLDSLAELDGALSNYKSYEEELEAADALFQKEVDKGFVYWSMDRTELEKKFGALVPSAIGYISKVKLDGTVKGRLVHDLRRSQVNEHITLKERLVLPRLKDALEDTLQLLETKTPNERVLYMSLDFSDAFKHLAVRENEYRYLSGRALGGFFVYKTVLFGIKTGPLVWGRMAALIARSTQSLFHISRCRLQIFVDDPLIVARGTVEQLNSIFNVILLWWLTLGLKVAWTKGAVGTDAEWIGAKLTVDDQAGFVRVSVTSSKVDEWRVLLQRLNTQPTVGRKALQQFTGKMSWAAGFIPQLKPFVRMLYAAMATSPAKLQGQGQIYYRQIEPALKWIHKFLWSCGSEGLERTICAHSRHHCRLDFLVDASPWGGGAVRLRADKPVEVFTLHWTEMDEKKTGAMIGSPGSQALWEAYMMLRCLWAWVQPGEQGFIRIARETSSQSPSSERSDKRSGTTSRCPFRLSRGVAPMERAKRLGRRLVPWPTSRGTSSLA